MLSTPGFSTLVQAPALERRAPHVLQHEAAGWVQPLRRRRPRAFRWHSCRRRRNAVRGRVAGDGLRQRLELGSCTTLESPKSPLVCEAGTHLCNHTASGYWMRSEAGSADLRGTNTDTKALLLRARTPSRGRRRQPRSHGKRHRVIGVLAALARRCRRRVDYRKHVLTRKHLQVRANRHTLQDNHIRASRSHS